MITSLISLLAPGSIPPQGAQWQHPQLPPQASTFADEHDSLYVFVEWINYVFFFGIMLFLFYAVIKYRRKSEDQAPASTLTHHTALEVTWTVGPKSVIEAVSSAGSFLDGGASRPLQRAAIELLDVDRTKKETEAIAAAFGVKRQRLLTGLRDVGFDVDVPPEGTFYVWASARHLPPGLNDGMSFFSAALEQKVITVPGEFFDVDPGKRRGVRPSRFRKHLRFSFGPPLARIDDALERILTLIVNGAKAS